MAFDVDGARKAGYSDAEIADHLAQSAKFDAGQARKAGYSDAEIVSHLAGKKSVDVRQTSARTHDGLPARQNADGSYSTELSITVTNPRLNGGRPTNIPSLWGGVELDEDRAVDAALKSGRTYGSYGSVAEAVEAAKARSAAGGAEADRPSVGLRGVPRQIGLTARHVLEGLGQAADVVTEPARQIVVNPLLRYAGMQPAASTWHAAADLADRIGLPAAQTPYERMAGDVARLVTSSVGMSGLSGAAVKATTGPMQKALATMAANPGIQAVGAATAGAAGGGVREAGGGPMAQLAAALGGAVLGGSVAAKVSAPRVDKLVQADGLLELTAQRAGVDWNALSNDVRTGLRQEVADALKKGPLDEAALRRLMAFRATGTTPTRGMLTQNPGAITREQNLARMAANSGDMGLQRLPMLENQNTSRLLSMLDEAGAAKAPTNMGAGRAALDSLDSTVSAEQANINSLYRAARDTQGRSLPLEGGTFTRRANELLDEANVGSFLPPDIVRKMNDIALGKYPLTVDVAEQLKTSIGRLQRGSSDGNMRYALGLVRQALDDVPLQNSVNPGNLPAVPSQVPASVGQESIDAFNAARSANRAWMQRVESNPALKAAVDGVEPDQFFQKFVVGKGASAKDVGGLVTELDDASKQALKQALVRHLKDSATNSTDDIVKFTNAGYRRALRDIGEDKLKLFFSREELQQLRDIGDAAKYMQAQPAGSAVNNSNSGALVAGRFYDLMDRIAGFVPLGGRDILRGKITQPLMQRQALNPQGALVLKRAAQPTSGAVVNPLLAVSVGLPSPESAEERIVSDAARLVAASGGMSGLAASASRAVSGPMQSRNASSLTPRAWSRPAGA